MSSLLPLFVSAQSGPQTIGGGREATGRLIPDSNKNQLAESGQAFPPAFSRILRESNETPVLGPYPQSAGSTKSQHNTASNKILTQKDFQNLESLLGSDAAEKVLGGLQSFLVQGVPEAYLPPTTDTLLNLQSPIIPSFDGEQTPARILFQSIGVQQPGGNSTLGSVRQESAIGEKQLGVASYPLSKTPEGGIVLSQGSQPEEALPVRTVVPSGKDVPSGSQQAGRSILENKSLQNPFFPKISSPLARPHIVQPNSNSPIAVIQTEGPAGFTGTSLTAPISEKTIPGHSSVLSDMSGSGIEHRTTVTTDLLGEVGLLAKGERGQTMIDTSVKSVGLDPSGGQGLGYGMNHFSNSQSGSQQPSSFQGQGVGFRVLEERGQEFPAPVLQRLQMDVQVSENLRVQIDVGVHNRQVYTGLILDHSVLRNLATQFVPQLENQLAEVDLELQEFSAEFRGEQEQEQETGGLFNNDRSSEAQDSNRTAQDQLLLTQNSVGRQEEAGLHFVV